MAEKIDPQVVIALVKSEVEIMVSTIRDKGGKRFGKAFGFAGVMVALAYFGLYSPPQKKIGRLQREIDKAKAMSEAGGQYKDIRDQLAAAYAQVPQMKDREQWLSNAMIDSLRADNLTPDSFKPVSENELSGLIFQSSTVQLTIKFEQFYDWLMRLEGARPLMHVASFDVQKKPEALGWNGVTCEVTTVIPKRRFN
jgi:type II secretory pathway component PulM